LKLIHQRTLRRKEEGGRRKEEGGRRKEEGGRRKEEGGRREEEKEEGVSSCCKRF
jgi:hypothetical protein